VTIHRGTVLNNVDPEGLGRMQVLVPDISAEPLPWALPVVPLGVLQTPPPPVGADVWVAFENDDQNYPVVLGTLPTAGVERFDQ
jgi:hypothetical protein